MAYRTPSPQSQQELAMLLLHAGFQQAKLVAVLAATGRQQLAFELPFATNAQAQMVDGIAFLARSGNLTPELLDALEAAVPGRKEEFDRLRVDMEFAAPPRPLLPPPELDAAKRAAHQLGLHDELGHARLRAKLPGALLAGASTSLDRAEQLDAWFDAANRQRLGPGDRAFMLALLARALDAGTAAGGSVLRDTLNRLRLTEPTDLRDVALTPADEGSLQRLVQTYGIELSMGAFFGVVAASLERVCLVRVGGADAGTGFLVGDDLVLTAFHVLEPVISANSDAPVELLFDYLESGGAVREDGPRVVLSAAGTSAANPKPWLVACSESTDGEREGKSPRDITAADDALQSELASRLDFALVRLATPIGRTPRVEGGSPRGHFEIAAKGVPFPFSKGTALMIVGHPKAQGAGARACPQVFSMAPDAVIAKNERLSRVRYRTNTRAGSSGSPVLALDGRVVALHHFGKEGAYNQGVPLSAIVAVPAVAAALAAGGR